ncbi:MAG: lipase family protein [Bacteroidota bacterium]
MQKVLLLPLFLLLSLAANAQEVISAESQGTTFAFILSVTVGRTVDYDVENYAITYTTTDPFGQPDTATGLLCIPVATDLVFPLAVYNHGTVDSRDAVPSVPMVQERFVVQGISAFGFIAMAPDYLGLGGSDGIHPYFHAETEASAGLDMLIAVRAWLDEQDIPRNDQVYVTGYSQGGHASMALHKTMEADTDGPTITAAAHLSGAYVVNPPSPVALGLSEVEVGSFRFFLNQIIGYEFVYNLYGGVNSLFVDPYLPFVQQFINDEISLQELSVNVDSTMQANNHVVGEIFVEQFVTDVLDDDPDLVAAWTENTVLDFAPEVPTLIYFCNGDEVVSPAQAQGAFDNMTGLGSTSVVIEDGGDFNHFDCVPPAALAAIDFFKETAAVFPVSLGNPADRPEIQLSPNPVAAGRELSVTGITESRPYILYDQSGRSLLQGQTTTNGGITLPARIPQGMLVLRIGLSDGSSVVRRVVVNQ